MATKKSTTVVTIRPPNMQTAEFHIEGTAPLVIHRMDPKLQAEFRAKVEAGSTPTGKKKHEAREVAEIVEAAKYIGQTNGERWDGFNASAVRCACIDACRIVNYKMTLAKMSIFCLEDGRDIYNPLYPLVRIIGNAEPSEMMGRTSTGVAMLIFRPMYFPWAANLRLRFDGDQFKLQDVTNLLARVGMQVGLCEGRPFSKNSSGVGWGTFEITGA